MKRYFLFIVFVLSLCSFQQVQKKLFCVPKDWPIPKYDFSKNELTPAKLLLGRVLFYDPILSSNNEISCASCHSQYTAFTHVDHQLSHGVFDSICTRNSPALMNLAWQSSFMWDGAIRNLDMQSLAPISHEDEMGSSIAEVVIKLNASLLYPSLFYNAFGDSLATGEHTLKALSQFMLSLISANSKYDQVKRGEASFTEQEVNGFELFLANCNSCHLAPLFSTFDFANNGLPLNPELNDLGRMGITNESYDSLQFKIPSLRNVEFSFPYMHDGRFPTIAAVLNHYTDGVLESATLAHSLENRIVLSSNEKVDLISFLLCLTDKEFLFNKDFSYPRDILLNQTKDN